MPVLGPFEASGGDAPPSRAAWKVTAAGALAVMAALAFGRFSYTMFLPAMRESLQLSYTAAGFLATANLAGYLVGSLAAGILLSRLGARPAATGGLCVLALSLAWTGAARGLADLSAARALAGAAGAIVYVQALALVPQWFGRGGRGLATGVVHAGNGAGLVLTGLGLPLVIGAVPGTSWRAGWGALGLATLPLLPLAWIFLRPPEASRGAGDGPLAVGGRNPLARSWGRTSLAAYAAIYALFGISYVIYVTFFAETLHRRGLSLGASGLAWATLGALSLASGPLWGSLSDRLGRLEGLAVVFGLQGIAYVAFLEGTPLGLMVSVGLFGATAWGVPAIMAAASGELVRPEDAPMALGRITTVMGVGQAVGPLLAGALADATGIVGSGLWIATLAAVAGVGWSLAAAVAENRVRVAT